MRARQAFSTSVGTKLLLALTGLALVGFPDRPSFGNLLLFFGPEATTNTRTRLSRIR